MATASQKMMLHSNRECQPAAVNELVVIVWHEAEGHLIKFLEVIRGTLIAAPTKLLPVA